MYRLTFLFFLLVFALVVRGQSVISGVVSNEAGQPLPGVMVRIYAQGGSQVLAFGQTNKTGHYRLEVKTTEAASLTVRYAHLSYKTVEARLPNAAAHHDVQLTERVVSLKAATARAPHIRQRGDTITYSVAALKGKADRNIEDVIRRIPGIEVDKSGQIKYQGESINSFYIEGLNLLKGNYGLATRNIRPDDVLSVSVLENHQPRKVLRDIELSKRAALNLTLKQSALRRPMGYVVGGAGATDGGALRGLGEAYVMRFAQKHQSIYTLKGNNFADDYAAEHRDFLQNAAASPAAQLLSDTPFGSSSVEPLRHRDNLSLMGNFRTLRAFTPERTLTLSGRYVYNGSDFAQSRRSDYFGLATPLTIQEDIANTLHSHRIDLAVDYERNEPTQFLTERLAVQTLLRRNTHTLSPGGIDQRLRQTDLNLTNTFGWTHRSGRRLAFLDVRSALSTTPEAHLTARRTAPDTLMLRQRLTGLSASTRLSTRFLLQLGEAARYGSISVGATATGRYDRLTSDESVVPSSRDNDVDLAALDLTLAPRYEVEWLGLHWRLDLPLTHYLRNYRDRSAHTHHLLNRPYAAPTLTLYCRIGASLLTWTSGRSTTMGKVRDWATAPIFQTYRYRSAPGLGSTTISHDTFSRFEMMWRDVYAARTFTATAQYARSEEGSMQSSDIDAQGREQSAQVATHRPYHNWLATARTTIHSFPIHTNFALGLRYTGSAAPLLRQSAFYTLLQHNFRVELLTNTRLWHSLFQIDLNLHAQRALRRMDGSRTTLDQSGATLDLSFDPDNHWEATLGGDLRRTEVQPGRHLNIFFLDGRARYKQKRWEVELRVRNLAGARAYTLRSYVQADVYTYTYRLRPAEALLSLRWNL